jgi:hypothetical protein
MDVPDSEVIAELTYDGHAVADFFLIGGLVCHVNTRGKLMAAAINDPALAAATVAYLRRVGAREYPSVQAYLERGPANPALQ